MLIGAGIGIPFQQNVLARLLGSAEFFAPLTHSAIPTRAASGTTATFTRATTSTWQNNDGYLVTGVAGEIGFPGARRVRNLMVASENFTGAAWTEGRATLSANSTTAPNGTTTATTITSNSALAASHFLIDDNTLVPSNEFRLYSIHVKPSTHNYVALNIQGGVGNYVTKVFDLANGVVGETFVGGTSGTLSNASITSVGSGWFRISMMAKITSAGIRNFVVFFASAATGNTINTTGDINIASAAGTEDFYLWGAQLEDVTAQTTQTAGEYVSVGVESAPYYHGSMVDGVKCFPTDLSGNPIPSTTMLGYQAEGARTNLCLQSQTFDNASWTLYANSSITANQAVAPDGTTTADLLYPTITAAPVGIYQQITLAAATATTSVYAKAAGFSWFRIVGDSGSSATGVWFNLASGNVGTATSGYVGTIEDAGNGWYRCSVAHPSQANPYFELRLADADNSNNATASGTNGIYLWGAQIESAVSFASSYIPTTTIAVTRNADVLTYSASNYSPTAGWAYAEFTTETPSGTQIDMIDAYSGGGLIPMLVNSGDNLALLDPSISTRAFTAVTKPVTTPKKAATSWGGTTAIGSYNGSAAVSTAYTTGAATNPLAIGSRADGTQSIFGTIRNVRIGQRALSSSELQAVTA